MNWMNKWEKAQEEAEDARTAKEQSPAKAKLEMEHTESLVKENILFMLNELAHGKFESARTALSECRERYPVTNPELVQELSKIDEILTAQQNPETKENNPGTQLDLPL